MGLTAGRLPWQLLAVLACIGIATARPASAQIRPQAAPRTFCLTGRPAPACQLFLIAEGNAYTPVAGSRYTRTSYRGGTTTRSLELTWYVAWEVGGMMNLGPHHAAGASALLGGDANGARVGVKGRYRYWMDAATAVDVGAGVLRAGRSVTRPDGPGNDHVPAVGLTGDVSVGVVEWASVGVRADVLFSDEAKDPATAYYIGTRLGTRPSLVLSAAPLLLVLVGILVVGTGSP